jgi:hypothetical protein
MTLQKNNTFSMDYLSEVFNSARKMGYTFVTMSEYLKIDNTSGKYFITRLDLDFKPATLQPFVTLSQTLSIPFTIFVRVGGPYNFLWYPNFKVIDDAERSGCEIGLHGAPVEWADLLNRNTEETFASELAVLRSKFRVSGFAPHRDINYVYNSLPWLEQQWSKLERCYNLTYHAYQEVFLRDIIYVNEGFSPHLGWRNMTPIEAMETKKNIYMLLHPHWWHVDHPYEADWA